MTHLADLAPYDYRPGVPAALAVGWLDSGMAFPSGPCPRDVRDRLAELCATPVLLTRGFHFCQLCATATQRAGRPRTAEEMWESPDVARGNGELWITHDGTNFAAPSMVLHYVGEHDYAPPPAFVAAVRFGTPTPGLD